MDLISIVIDLLKAKNIITPLEKDILDTVDELKKRPFERSSAELKMALNYTKYPEIFIAVGMLSAGPAKPRCVLTDDDIKCNLEKQLGMLVEKEWDMMNSGGQAGANIGGKS